jgi:pyruvate carboxylase subunit B
MVLGYFGKTPVPADPEIIALASEQMGLEPTTRNPREINDEDSSKGIPAATKLLTDEGLEVTDESIFIASALKEKGVAFLKGDRPDGVRKVNSISSMSAEAAGANAYTVEINKKKYEVSFDGGKARINGKNVDYSIAESTGGGGGGSGATGEGEIVAAELAGQVLRVVAGEGDQVEEGDVLLMLEALKMEIEVKAPRAGTVAAILVSGDQTVGVGDALVEIV